MSSGALAFALVAGAVAAFNPCGFALLPAYLGLLVAGDSPGGRVGAAGRAVRFAAGMTLGFVAVFGLFGALLAPLAGSVGRYLPVVTIVMGALLVGLGGALLAGRSLGVPGLAGRGAAPTARWWSQVGYGVSFALASLSCTIGPFLAVTAGTVVAGGVLGVTATFVAYALGMGTVVLALALAVATAREWMVAAMRRAGAMISRASGALLVIAGGYVAWYGVFELRVLAGDLSPDPVISAAVGVQEGLSRAVTGFGAGGLLLVGAGTLALVLVGAVLARRARPRRARDASGRDASGRDASGRDASGQPLQR